jgi:hypothetical protein
LRPAVNRLSETELWQRNFFGEVSQILTLYFTEVCGAMLLKFRSLKPIPTGCSSFKSHLTASHRQNVIQGGVQDSQYILLEFESGNFEKNFLCKATNFFYKLGEFEGNCIWTTQIKITEIWTFDPYISKTVAPSAPKIFLKNRHFLPPQIR